ncbi:glycosyltransferase [Oceanobacillus sp. CF4.6]|uniref:glycosyltransferase n=1 Tax=Oceanobacillus sp. CF4.6 TaxID=3373080 RepID=UPI003EE6ECC9
MPKVSVIIPLYKVERYIHKCIESVLNQTLYDIELILVNDGSPDKCGDIADEYKEKDTRVKVIHKKNGGLSSARNAGLAIASGEFVSFIDSDDWIEVQMIEIMYKNAIRSNSDVSICNYNRVFENHIKTSCLSIKDEVVDINEIGLSEYYYQYFFLYIHGHEVTNKLYKRSIIDDYLITFENNKEVFSEDVLFNTYFLCNAERICSTRYSFYNYLQRSNSIMNSPRINLTMQYYSLVEKLIIYAKKNDKQEDIRNIAPVLLYYLIRTSLNNLMKRENNIDILRITIKEVIHLPYFKSLMIRLAFGNATNIYCRKTHQGKKTNIYIRVYALFCLTFSRGLAKLIMYDQSRKSPRKL